MAYKQYTKGGYNITEDPQFGNDRYAITPILAKRFNDLYFEVKELPDAELIEELKDLIKANPNCPQLKNYLAVAYERRGETENFVKVNNQILTEHPDYLFGRITQANIYLNDDNFDEALRLLGKSLSIKDLYPDRDLFHLSEVLGYLKIVGMYRIRLKELEEAEAVLAHMKEIKDDHCDVDDVENMLIPLRVSNTMDYFTELHSKKKNRGISVLENFIQVTNTPKFNHAEVNYLYTNGLTIERDLLKEILALPRETLIEDLELVLKDAVIRYSYFLGSEYEEGTQSFPLHAVFLLMELNAESSLPKILDFLHGDEKFFDFWLSDHITETIWQCLYKLGYNNTKTLAEVLVDGTYYTFVKTSVSEALGQMALHNEAKQTEIAQIYTTTLNHYNATDFDADLIDHIFLGGVIGDAIDIGHKELLPTMEELYEKDYVDTFANGTYDMVVKEFDKRNIELHKRKVNNIFEIYEDVVENWAGYNPDKEFSNNTESGWGFSDFYQEPEYAKIEPIRVEPKIGRNDPCPCGSGKKHKKCCMTG